jgi:hypothetical protein
MDIHGSRSTLSWLACLCLGSKVNCLLACLPCLATLSNRGRCSAPCTSARATGRSHPELCPISIHLISATGERRPPLPPAAPRGPCLCPGAAASGTSAFSSWRRRNKPSSHGMESTQRLAVRSGRVAIGVGVDAPPPFGVCSLVLVLSPIPTTHPRQNANKQINITMHQSRGKHWLICFSFVPTGNPFAASNPSTESSAEA